MDTSRLRNLQQKLTLKPTWTLGIIAAVLIVYFFPLVLLAVFGIMLFTVALGAVVQHLGKSKPRFVKASDRDRILAFTPVFDEDANAPFPHSISSSSAPWSRPKEGINRDDSADTVSDPTTRADLVKPNADLEKPKGSLSFAGSSPSPLI